MQIIDIVSLSDQNIEVPNLVASYASDADREIYVQVYLSPVIGNGSYRICLTKQLNGGLISFQSPTSSVFVKSGATTIYLGTIAIPVESGDTVNVYVQGLTGDTVVDCVTQIFDNTIDNASIAAIKAKTDNLPASPADQSELEVLIAALPPAPSVNDIIAALKVAVFDGTLTFEDSIKLYNAILFGKLDGGGTGTLKFRDPADTLDRVTATVDLVTADRDHIILDLT